MAAVLSRGSAPLDSAYGAFLPTVVPRNALLSAYAAIATAYSVAEAAAFGAAGSLLRKAGRETTRSPR